VPTDRHSTKNGLRVFRNTMSSATRLALGKGFFAECPSLDTRQSIFYFLNFGNQTFCGMFLHYVDLHVPFGTIITVFSIASRFSSFI
jgi:hypothetical protein